MIASDPVQATIKRLSDRLRAAQAAGPPSLLKRMLHEAQQREQAQQPAPRIGGDLPPSNEPSRRKRKPTLAGVAKQAAKAGVEVAAYQMNTDGSIRIIAGKPTLAAIGDNDDDAPPAIDRSEWH